LKFVHSNHSCPADSKRKFNLEEAQIKSVGSRVPLTGLQAPHTVIGINVWHIGNCQKPTNRWAAFVTKIDDTYLDSLSRATNIHVAQHNRDGVRAQLERLAQMADLIMDFPLRETEEPITKLRHE